MATQKWASQQEAAAALNISIRSLQRMRNDGTLPIGKCWMRKVPANLNSHVIYDLAVCEYHLSAATIAARIEQDGLGQRALEAVA
jgi:hypothetical protein